MNDTEHRCKLCGWEPHAGPDSCPTWYDGCNCSPQICEDLIERLEAAEAIKKAQALKIGHLETLVMELERENRLPCAHVGRVRVLETEELARWVEIQVPLGEYREDDPDLLPLAAERLRELQAEVMRLKAHTWEQERAAVVGWLRTGCYTAAAGRIERGEHWPEGETP